MKTCIILMIMFITCLIKPSEAAPFKELVPNYNRTKSPAMVRSIDVPTRANLDYAAYFANPIRFDPEKQKPKRPAKKVTIGEMKFNGALVKAVSTAAETPLTAAELDNPLAWAPVMNQLWTVLHADGLKKIGATITAEKWNDPDVFKPYQDIAALYLHKANGKTEFWVRIEFMPWVSFLQGIGDEDADGFREIYGLLNTAPVDSTQLEKAVLWIASEYQKKALTESEIIDWANVLASYWYPTLNTDIVDTNNAPEWPTGQTEPRVRTSLKKLTVKNPTAVIRGNPYGKVLYNVFVANGLEEAPVAKTETAAAADVWAKELDTTKPGNFQENADRFAQELKPRGDYASWVHAVAPVHEGLKKVLVGVPKEQRGIVGSDGWLFFRKSVDYILSPDLSLQPPDKNPVAFLREFKAYLDKNNINFLFVAVPCKEELYYDKLGQATTKETGAIIAPYGRKILADLQKGGIEVIDLLPRFLEAKTADALSAEPVFQKQDTHWTTRGMEEAAALIAARIREYAWFTSCSDLKKSYTVIDTTTLRQGDIVERIPETLRSNYPAPLLAARQVVGPDGEKYKPDPGGPIMLIGDSFTGVFELVDCKSAGVGAHIALKTGLPVDILTGWGGGPMIMNKLLRTRKNSLGNKRLVIFMMTARDLYNYSQGWEKLKVD